MRNRNSVKVRRDHKDTLFRMIFSTRENLLSLYNAVNHSHYTDAKELEIVTLENAVYMNMKNDPRNNLLNSLKPYLRDNKKEKLDNYINLLNMSKIAETLKNSQNNNKDNN